MAQEINLGRVVGPNDVSAATTTPLSGVLTGDGANVGAVEALPVEMGGTGATDSVTVLRNLGARSNPNLLDNWDLRNPVNSQQKKSYTTTTSGDLYIIDGWHLNNASSNNVVQVTLTETGILYSSTISVYGHLGQSVCDVPVGTVLTASASIGQNQGWIRLIDRNPDGTIAQAFNSPVTSDGISKITFTVKGSGGMLFLLRSNDGEETLFHAAKLELGSVSTLAYDLDQPSDFRAQALKLTGSTGGMDLSRVMTAAELHSQIAAGIYSNIHTGDYWPITLNGTFHDYATDTDKTLSNAVVNLEFMPNFYSKNYGDTVVIGNHCLVCSRDCLPVTLQMRSANDVWYDEAQTNPFLGSHLYQTLNASDGILALVEQTELGAYIGSMQFLWETKAKGATAATGWTWSNRGKLFLPTEREVWGQDVWSEHTYGGFGNALQWPIFAGSRRHIIKGLGNGGSRFYWWSASSSANSAVKFCNVSANNVATSYDAIYTYAVPLCFIIV